MKELRDKLVAQANNDIDQMASEGSAALRKVVKKSGVNSNELASLIVDRRTGSLRKTLVSRMVKQAADELLKKYTDQMELPIDKDKKK